MLHSHSRLQIQDGQVLIHDYISGLYLGHLGSGQANLPYGPISLDHHFTFAARAGASGELVVDRHDPVNFGWTSRALNFGKNAWPVLAM
jgi:hypothetical protein